MATLRDTYDSRIDEFGDGYEFEEQDEVIRALAVTGEMLDLIFIGDEASLAMTALRSLIAHGTRGDWDWGKLAEKQVIKDWRGEWSEINGWEASSTPPFLDELHELHAFAYFGIVTTWNDAGADRIMLPEGSHLRERLASVQDMPKWVEGICVKIDQFERLAPRQADGMTALSVTLTTRDLARARIKLDQGKPITVHELAGLSHVSVKRIQNAIYAKTAEAPVVDRNGLISPEACEPWLLARDYHQSIWKQISALYPLERNWGKDIAFESSDPDRLVDDFVFVPVANDGTMFIPNLRREGKGHEGGFTIGAKGSEHVVGDFDSALDELRRMETPRWRRPNVESGNWGVVTGQTWKRVRRAELNGLSQ